MIDFQQSFKEQFEQIGQFQKNAAEKLQSRSAVGVDNWEKFARYNLAVMGDWVDFSVEQARLATTVSEPQEFFGKQADNVAAFSRVLEGRTREYLDLVSAAGEEMREPKKEKKVVKAVKKSA